MITYSKFSPSTFDVRGLGLPDRQSWLVVPCGRNRDSEPFDESNFVTALKLLGGASETVEVHRFGHWANGWFEVILVQPDGAAAAIALDIEERLDNYPILDEDDLSYREELGR
jgi:hypothetical protein